MSVRMPILMPPPLIWCATAACAQQSKAAMQSLFMSFPPRTSNAQIIDQFLVAGADLVARQRLLHLAVDDEDVPVGEGQREVQVRFHQQHRLALRLQLAQDPADLL